MSSCRHRGLAPGLAVRCPCRRGLRCPRASPPPARRRTRLARAGRCPRPGSHPAPSGPRREHRSSSISCSATGRMLRGPEAAHITDYLEAQGYVEEAVEGLRSRSRWTARRLGGLLGRMRSDAAVAALVELMGDESDDVRMMAARSLAAIGDPAAVDALTTALADSSRWTATTVATDLIEMGPRVSADPHRDRRLGRLRQGRRARGGRHRGPCARRDPRSARCARARPPVDERGQPERPRPGGRGARSVGGPMAPPALRAALLDEAWQVRAQAAASLGALGDRGEHPGARATAIEDESWWVRRNCAEALGALGEPGREALSARWRPPRTDTCATAASPSSRSSSSAPPPRRSGS